MALIGFVYRGGIMVHVPAYILVYFIAKRLLRFAMTTRGLLVSLTVLVGSYCLMGSGMEDAFHYGVYLRYMVTCLAAIATLMIAVRLLGHAKPNRVVVFLSDISMEIYLVHHYFVYDQPLYVCAPLTFVLACLLHWVANKVRFVLEH